MVATGRYAPAEAEEALTFFELRYERGFMAEHAIGLHGEYFHGTRAVGGWRAGVDLAVSDGQGRAQLCGSFAGRLQHAHLHPVAVIHEHVDDTGLLVGAWRGNEDVAIVSGYRESEAIALLGRGGFEYHHLFPPTIGRAENVDRAIMRFTVIRRHDDLVLGKGDVARPASGAGVCPTEFGALGQARGLELAGLGPVSIILTIVDVGGIHTRGAHDNAIPMHGNGATEVVANLCIGCHESGSFIPRAVCAARKDIHHASGLIAAWPSGGCRADYDVVAGNRNRAPEAEAGGAINGEGLGRGRSRQKGDGHDQCEKTGEHLTVHR